MRLITVAHTLWYLGVGQILARPLRPLRRLRLRYAPTMDPRTRPASGANWIPGRSRSRQWLDATTFSIFGETRSITGARAWNPPSANRLWTYHLHYHDDLADPRDPKHERNLISSWIAANPPPHGPGWEPYPLSRRIVNWVGWLLRGGGIAPPGALASLAQQAWALSHQIENDLRANHLWTNGKALVFAGCYLAGRDADRWLHQGLEIIRRELAEQVLPDGGHYERAPLYHALFIEDLLDLINLARLFPDAIGSDLLECWKSTALAMLAWLRTMSRTDGSPCGFGDTVAGSAPPLESLFDYAQRLQPGMPVPAQSNLQSLDASRYVRVEQNGTVVWFDRGGPAPGYQPGHSHAAALSFELECRGHPVIVNPGISTYQEGEVRSWERSTGAHNTLRLDQRDQSEMWSAFRVGRRARPLKGNEGAEMDCVWMAGAHDGYRPVIHSRRIEVSVNGARLRILDHLAGPRAWHGVEIYFYLAPGWEAECADGDEVVARHSVSNRTIHFHIPKELAAWIELASYHPDFGVSVPCNRIRLFAPVEISPAGITLATSIEIESHENSLLRGQLSSREECASLAGL